MGVEIMLSVKFIEDRKISDNRIKYVIMVSFFKDRLVVVRHKDRKTWEIPGGHREEFEISDEAAKRELFEETGATEFEIEWVCTYSVDRGKGDCYGQLYYAEIERLGDLPESEIEEIKTAEGLPDQLTYPQIQPRLYKKVMEYIKNNKGNFYYKTKGEKDE